MTTTETTTFQIGDRIQAGKGEDFDTGRIIGFDGDMAIVAWDSGVRTPCPIEDMTPAED